MAATMKVKMPVVVVVMVSRCAARTTRGQGWTDGNKLKQDKLRAESSFSLQKPCRCMIKWSEKV